MYLLLYYTKNNIKIVYKVGPKKKTTTKSEGLYTLQGCARTMVTHQMDFRCFCHHHRHLDVFNTTTTTYRVFIDASATTTTISTCPPPLPWPSGRVHRHIDVSNRRQNDDDICFFFLLSSPRRRRPTPPPTPPIPTPPTPPLPTPWRVQTRPSPPLYPTQRWWRQRGSRRVRVSSPR